MFDHQAFSNCSSRSLAESDPRHCYSNLLLVTNNTERLGEIPSPDPLLCLAVDNLVERNEYLDRRPAENASDFEAMRSRHKAFLWPEALNETGTDSPFAESIYTAGKPIWTHRYLVFIFLCAIYAENIFLCRLSDDSLGLLSLPDSGRQDGDCGFVNPIRYMEDRITECRRYIKSD